MTDISSSMLGHYLGLFAQTEIFVFVFMEIVAKIEPVQNVMFKKADLKNYAVFITLFGLFSVFGTYIGTAESTGAITNIRDLAPIVAGLVAGPLVGVSVGLIGGIHRFFLGGVSCIPCSMATALAGLIAGLIFYANKGKMIGIVPAILLGAGVELMHGGLALAIIQPFSVALNVVVTSIPQMVIAISLGVGISMVIIHSAKEHTHTPKQTEQPPENTHTFSFEGRPAWWQNKPLCKQIAVLRRFILLSRHFLLLHFFYLYN